MPENATCGQCGGQIGSLEGVTLTPPDQAGQLLCRQCFNAYLHRELGGTFEHPWWLSFTLDDCDGTSHRFELCTRLIGNVVSVRVVEPREDGTQGYELEMQGEAAEDPRTLLRLLLQRLRRALGRHHLFEPHRGP